VADRFTLIPLDVIVSSSVLLSNDQSVVLATTVQVPRLLVGIHVAFVVGIFVVLQAAIDCIIDPVHHIENAEEATTIDQSATSDIIDLVIIEK
jgi:hypothetical protein